MALFSTTPKLTSSYKAETPKHIGEALKFHWPILLGYLALALPTLYAVGTQAWSLEIGTHGPIVLATGMWLIARVVRSMPLRQPGDAALTALLMIVALPIYVFGRAYDFLSLETGALWIITIGAAWSLFGREIRDMAFPLVYLAFLIPPPGWMVDQLTAPLQQFVSYLASEVLLFFGYPIIRSGVTIFVAQYQLLVEQACSGMNSLIGLTAISLFYIYIIYGSSWRYSILLTGLILPIAIIANVMRVITLVLITYHFGDAAAQGFLHSTTGIVMFTFVLLLLVAFDSVLRKVLAVSRWAPLR